MSPCYGARPGSEFLRPERPGDTVVGAQVEPQHPVGLAQSCGGHDGWHSGSAAGRPEVTAYLELRLDRRQDVNDDQVERRTARMIDRSLGRANELDVDNAVGRDGARRDYNA